VLLVFRMKRVIYTRVVCVYIDPNNLIVIGLLAQLEQNKSHVTLSIRPEIKEKQQFRIVCAISREPKKKERSIPARPLREQSMFDVLKPKRLLATLQS